VAGEISTIQSLKAVDAWIDVINANINGGVRTGFKSSRLKFSGSNADVQRAGTATSLPLQFPESGLTTANTVIDFSQGAITASTETTHLAIQGEGFFLLASPDVVIKTPGASFGWPTTTAASRLYLTRDGEFHTDANGFLVHSSGYYLMVYSAVAGVGRPWNGGGTIYTGNRAVYNDIDNPILPAGTYFRLSDFLTNTSSGLTGLPQATGVVTGNCSSLCKVALGKQSLQYTQLGSTVFDTGFVPFSATGSNQQIKMDYGVSSDATVLSKSLEASNASMTQSVPELSLAQKLFSALTKVLQTKQTNVDGVLNLVR
jgi:flagellar hook protein FlgE